MKYLTAISGFANLVLAVLLYMAYNNLNACRSDRDVTVDQNKGLVTKVGVINDKLKTCNANNNLLVESHNREVQAFLTANDGIKAQNAVAIKALQGAAGYWAGAARSAKPIPQSDVCSVRLDNIGQAVWDYRQEVLHAQ